MKTWLKSALVGFVLGILMPIGVFLKEVIFFNKEFYFSLYIYIFILGFIFFVPTGAIIGELFFKKNPQRLKSHKIMLVGLLIMFISLSYGFVDMAFKLKLTSSGGGDGYDILLLIFPIIIGVIVFILGLIGWIVGKIKAKKQQPVQIK